MNLTGTWSWLGQHLVDKPFCAATSMLFGSVVDIAWLAQQDSLAAEGFDMTGTR
jgi:hypothetical protein